MICLADICTESVMVVSASMSGLTHSVTGSLDMTSLGPTGAIRTGCSEILRFIYLKLSNLIHAIKDSVRGKSCRFACKAAVVESGRVADHCRKSHFQRAI